MILLFPNIYLSRYRNSTARINESRLSYSKYSADIKFASRAIYRKIDTLIRFTCTNTQTLPGMHLLTPGESTFTARFSRCLARISRAILKAFSHPAVCRESQREEGLYDFRRAAVFPSHACSAEAFPILVPQKFRTPFSLSSVPVYGPPGVSKAASPARHGRCNSPPLFLTPCDKVSTLSTADN